MDTDRNQTETAGQEHINEQGSDYDLSEMSKELLKERFGKVPLWERIRTPHQRLTRHRAA